MKSALSLLVVAHCALALLLPMPDGPYRVKWESFELVDDSRVDPFNSTHLRRMMISQFTPVKACDCKELCTVPYMPPEIATFEDDIFAAYLAARGVEGWVDGVLNELEVKTCCAVDAVQSAQNFETILLGPGINTTRLFYTVTAQHIASLGYNVITLDHPYETDVVLFPNGDIIFGGRVLADPSQAQFGLDVRTEDVQFVLDTFDISKTVYTGGSFGGASAANAMVNDTRIVGGVDMDGSIFGRAPGIGVTRPFLVLASEPHQEDDTWTEFFDTMAKEHPDVWARKLAVVGSVHNSFSDFGAIGDVSGMRENQELVDILFGNITGSRMLEILQEYISDFVEFTLGNGDLGLLAGESPEFPEVEFLI